MRCSASLTEYFQAAEDEKSRLVEQFEDVKQQEETVEAELLELTVQQNTLREEIERLSQGSQGVRVREAHGMNAFAC